MLIRSRGVAAAVAAALLWQTGCASKLSGPTPAPTTETRPALGRIGVAAVPHIYKGRLVTPAKGTWGGMITGAYVVGYGPLLIASIVVSVASFTAPPVAIIAGAAAGGAVLVGGIGGGLLAGSAEEVETAEAAMNKALAAATPHRELRDRIVRLGVAGSRHKLVLAPGGAPGAAARAAGLNSVLVLRITGFRLKGGSSEYAINPIMRLRVTVRARLIRASDDKTIYAGTWDYTSRPHFYFQWGKDDARLLRAEIAAAYDKLGGRIIRDLFAARSPGPLGAAPTARRPTAFHIRPLAAAR